MTCVHCGGDGILLVREYDPMGRMEVTEYDAPCHACPAGWAWTEAMSALDGTDGGADA